jgi:hypothetical protein
VLLAKITRVVVARTVFCDFITRNRRKVFSPLFEFSEKGFWGTKFQTFSGRRKVFTTCDSFTTPKNASGNERRKTKGEKSSFGPFSVFAHN